MSVPGEPIRENEILVRYLLGTLPEDHAERLDELSVSDDNFVWRLRAAENDLVDAYLCNELSRETLERFRSFYLSSALRRDKVKFAEMLLALRISAERHSGRWLAGPLPIPRWGLAASLAAVLSVGGFLVYDNTRLRNQVEGSKSRQPLSQPSAEVAMALTPPFRSAAAVPELSLPRGTTSARFDLELDADDFGSYRVELRNASGTRTLWRSEALQAHPAGTRRGVSVAIPAGLLEPETYILAVSAAGPDAAPVANYAFRVVSQ